MAATVTTGRAAHIAPAAIPRQPGGVHAGPSSYDGSTARNHRWPDAIPARKADAWDMTRRTSHLRRLAPDEIVFRTASGGILIAAAPRPQGTRLRLRRLRRRP